MGVNGADPPFRLRSLALAIISAVSFFAAGVTQAPASFLTVFFGISDANVQYRALSGSIWAGAIEDLTVSDIYFGDVSFRINPIALLSGTVKADIEVKGGSGFGNGRIAANLINRSFTLRDAQFEFNLAAIQGYTLFGIPYRGWVRTDIKKIFWKRAGCSAADADVHTTALNEASKQFVGDGLILEGSATCNEDRLQVNFTGINDEGRANITVEVASDMTYQATALVRAQRPTLQQYFRQLGFEDNGDALVYDTVGALKGVGP